MSIDGELRPLFRQHLRAGIQWTSIESGGTGGGIPDSEFCAEGGLQCWCEFKQTTGWTVTLSKEQSAWHTVRHLRGGRSLIAVRRWPEAGVRRAPADELWIFLGRHAAELRAGGLRAGVPCLGIWEGGPSRWDWDAVRRVVLEAARGEPHTLGA